MFIKTQLESLNKLEVRVTESSKKEIEDLGELQKTTKHLSEHNDEALALSEAVLKSSEYFKTKENTII